MDSKFEAEKICNAVEDIAQGKLAHKDDLLRLLEIALQSNQMILLDELTFNAKYIQGLTKIIQKSDNNIDAEYFEKVKNEFLSGISKIKTQFADLIEHADDFIKTIFNEKYLSMTQESLSNLNSLCNDLGFLKLYLNDLKRENLN